MICHVVLIRLKAEVKDSEAEQFMLEARKVLSPIPGVQNFRAGKGLGVKSEVDYPFCLVMEFEDESTLSGYQDHPEHQRFVKEILGPIGDDKQVYDYRY